MSVRIEKEKLVLRELLKESKFITPVLDEKYGLRFLSFEKALGASPEEAKEILEKLTEEGFLRKRLFAVIRKCIYCDAQTFIIIERCPECRSRRIKFNTIIQHTECGYSGAKEEFGSGDRMVCPFCGKTLANAESYKVLGYWYKCLDCDATFSEPIHTLVCVNCRNEMELEESDVRPVYEYEIVEKKVESEIPTIEMGRIEEILGNEWRIEYPSSIVGKSGISHVFTAIIRGNTDRNKDKEIIIDLNMGVSEVGEDAITRFYAKSVDIGSKSVYLVAIPKLSDRAKKIAETLNIRYVEGSTVEEAFMTLKRIIEE